MAKNKLKIALVFGGKSAEHEVSLRSAKNIALALDKDLFDLALVAISQQGGWFLAKDLGIFDRQTKITDTTRDSGLSPASMILQQGQCFLLNLDSQEKTPIDVAFPIIHGTQGEDGSLQGYFKMMNLPFVGCGIWASASGMDKEFMKRILQVANIPYAKYQTLFSNEKYDYQNLVNDLGTPFFIKPANAGSSVGVHKIKSAQDFQTKLADAFLYDHKVLAEEFIQGREIECSVMGANRTPEASLPGEIIPQHEFYSYEAKYLDDNGALLKIPAELDAKTISRLQELAKQTYTAMGCDGLTRVDFFVTADGRMFINEINTLPGFTKISMYPKMWEASGLSYRDLISKLIYRAQQRHQEEEQLKTTFD